MTERVFKYPADSDELRAGDGMFALEMPEGARPVLCAMQHGNICVWAIVNPDAPTERREFILRGTGHAIPLNAEHVHSFLMNDGEFVWHLFQRSPAKTSEAKS